MTIPTKLKRDGTTSSIYLIIWREKKEKEEEEEKKPSGAVEIKRKKTAKGLGT